MDSAKFDRMNLPKTSANEDLESLSRQKLLPLFPLELFELRDENQRDKGIDLTGELKRKGAYTNFRFAIQLKATQSQPNQDGSISFGIDVSNINYLMNNGMPAYYILYQKDLDAFFYEHATTVFEALNDKYADVTFPDKFTVRFDKPLTTAVLQKLHHDIFQRGILLRQLNEMLQVDLQRDQLSKNIVIDEDQQIYSKEDKIAFIETYGFLLLNKRDFQRIISTEQQCYPLPNVSASFHFISGMAYYHGSRMFKALDHFKNATLLKDQLNAELRSMLMYYSEMAKYSLGMTSADKIGAVIEGMKQSEYLKLYLRVEQAFNQFSEDTGDQDVSLKCFFDEMAAIKHDPVCDESMGMIVNSHILLVNGFDVNMRITQLLFDSKAWGFQTPEQLDAHQKLVTWFDERAQSLQKLALEQGNLHTYYIVCLNIIRTKYNYMALTNYIIHYDFALKRPDFKFNEADLKLADNYIIVLDQAAAYFEKESFMENLAVTLSIKFELQKFLLRDEDAEITSGKIARVIVANDLNSLTISYNALLNGHTAHDKTLKQVNALFNAMEELKDESTELLSKIAEMDKLAISKKPKPYDDDHQIHFIPLGIYSFPKEQLPAVFELIHTNEDARKQIRSMLEMGIMPIANAYSDPIVSEGPGIGIMAHKGLTTDRNLYRIRQGLNDMDCRKLR